MFSAILSALGAVGALLKTVGVFLGLVRDKQLRAEGVREAEHAQSKATLDAVEKANAIDSRPKPTDLKSSLDRL